MISNKAMISEVRKRKYRKDGNRRQKRDKEKKDLIRDR